MRVASLESELAILRRDFKVERDERLRLQNQLRDMERWEIGLRNIATILRGAQVPFEIRGIVDEVRNLKDFALAHGGPDMMLPIIACRDGLPEESKYVAWDADGFCQTFVGKPRLSEMGWIDDHPASGVPYPLWNKRWKGDWKESLHRLTGVDENGYKVVFREVMMGANHHYVTHGDGPKVFRSDMPDNHECDLYDRIESFNPENSPLYNLN